MMPILWSYDLTVAQLVTKNKMEETSSLFDDSHLPLEFKVVVLGDSNVGKTALVNWYVDKIATSHEATVGTSVHFKQLTCEEREVMLAIWDTAGQEKYASLGRIHSRNADAVLVCYDITNSRSLESVDDWLRLESLPDDVFVVLVGCKSDKCHLREVTVEEGTAKAKGLCQNGVPFYETSVVANSNVDEVFDFVLFHLVGMKSKSNRREAIRIIGTNSTTTTKKTCKC